MKLLNTSEHQIHGSSATLVQSATPRFPSVCVHASAIHLHLICSGYILHKQSGSNAGRRYLFTQREGLTPFKLRGDGHLTGKGETG